MKKQDNSQNRRRRKRPCPFTLEKAEVIDYRDVDMLKRFISDRGHIQPRRLTHLTARYQRMLAQAIKRARHSGLLPTTIN